MPIRYPSARAGLDGASGEADVPQKPEKVGVDPSSEVSGLDALDLAPKTDRGSLGKRIWSSAWKS